MKKITRRNFLWYMGSTLGWSAFFSVPQFFRGEPPVRPPGAVEEDQFMATCIRCTRCIEVCPRDAIRPATYKDSITYVGSPIFSGPCDRCLKCIKSCPSGALQPVEAVSVRTGTINIDQNRCVGCQLCLEGCDFNALEPVRNDDAIDIEVIKERCVGCGECIPHCPLDPPALWVVTDGEKRYRWQKAGGGYS